MKVKVSIPVTLGGYTGQRDQWEEHTYDCVVTVDGTKVTLKSDESFQRTFTLNLDELQAAVAFAEAHA